MNSGLYDELAAQKLLIAHTEVPTKAPDAYKVLRPELVPFISYPYEWSFSQLQDAALATLAIQRAALAKGMILRDASAYNIQFVDGKPCLIDTLSFDVYHPGEPWIAYRQFCQHFVAPLALMSCTDVDLLQLLRVYVDGVPLPLASKLLPLRSKARLGLATHITLHARLQQQHAGSGQKASASLSQTSLAGLIDNLEATVKGLSLRQRGTEWADYYDHTNYSDASLVAKGELVAQLAGQVKPARVLDLGGNNGHFSRLAGRDAALIICADIDPLAVEANYRHTRNEHQTTMLPLLIDLTNPSPALGWANQERSAFADRAQADLAVALALIHHLAISNNVPLELVAAYFAQLAPYLIIEFIPKDDSQVQRLLTTREDIFPHYTIDGFEAAFSQHYTIVKKEAISQTKRTLYLLKRKD